MWRAQITIAIDLAMRAWLLAIALDFLPSAFVTCLKFPRCQLQVQIHDGEWDRCVLESPYGVSAKARYPVRLNRHSRGDPESKGHPRLAQDCHPRFQRDQFLGFRLARSWPLRLDQWYHWRRAASWLELEAPSSQRERGAMALLISNAISLLGNCDPCSSLFTCSKKRQRVLGAS